MTTYAEVAKALDAAQAAHAEQLSAHRLYASNSQEVFNADQKACAAWFAYRGRQAEYRAATPPAPSADDLAREDGFPA